MKIAVGISRCNLILINPFQPAVLDFWSLSRTELTIFENPPDNTPQIPISVIKLEFHLFYVQIIIPSLIHPLLSWYTPYHLVLIYQIRALYLLPLVLSVPFFYHQNMIHLPQPLLLMVTPFHIL